jgi:nucleoside-diphosphate-sugar epimerase
MLGHVLPLLRRQRGNMLPRQCARDISQLCGTPTIANRNKVADPGKSLFCFGLGYAARALAHALQASNWTVAGTSREAAGVAALAALGLPAVVFDGQGRLAGDALDKVSHILVSAPPDASGDPVLRCCADELMARARQFAWVGYLSTTGVYGDHGGGWVDEDTPRAPVSERAKRRVAAEDAWLALHRDHGLPVHLFRLAGIYGPGRNQIAAVLDGGARRIVKPGQVFSRIHVEDVAGVLEASIARPNPGRAYNIADDEPAPPQDVVAFAAQLLGRPAPPEVPFEAAELSPMGLSFYGESKRISNRRIKQELGYRLKYPTYRDGLRALLPHPT